MVVYCPVDLSAINIAMSGEDPSYIPLLLSRICPNGHPDQAAAGGGGGDRASTSSNTHGNIGTRSSGSLIIVAFQILESSLPSAELNMESVTTVITLSAPLSSKLRFL
ncbi:hypothetical protein Dsin_006481 [Dipteronia sinensis]|uniref:HD-Zip IV C-terminal domain-containing protein n=1 Tax=Dipteronia sinensis TaxID=43782 RepID=A0AAE0AZU3_9ROSI|nr:hypothetical protein Dsin_006481 [Dipteronia sinensis]